MNTVFIQTEQSVPFTGNALLMNEYISKLKELSSLRIIAWSNSATEKQSEAITEVIDAAEFEARKVMETHADRVFVSLEHQIEELKSAKLEDKAQVLRTIPIVTVPVGAAFLGINERELHNFKYSCGGLFGARYAGRQCYSMDELFLVAQNPQWTISYTMAEPQTTAELPSVTMLEHLTFVDSEIAKAFTDMTYSELSSCVRPAYRNYHPFRLSDLEKIRVAKLNGQKS